MGLPRILVIIVVIFLAMRLFRIYVAPYLLRKGVEKMNQKMKDHMEGQFQGQGYQQREEGEITVERKKPTSGGKGVDTGEYVEFEEID